MQNSKLELELEFEDKDFASGSLTPRNNKYKKSLSFEKEKISNTKAVSGFLYIYSNEWVKTTDQTPVEIKHYSIDVASAKGSVEEFNSNEENFKGKEQKPQKSSKTSNKYQANDFLKSLHSFETQLTKEALSILNDKEKLVLLDIFAREDSGRVKIQEDGNPETHTIVLCKGKDDKIFLIDPNNSEFSSHLSTQYTDANIQVPDGVKKIYQPVGKIGKHINNSRDCIDIAVKLAYKLFLLDSSKISFKSKTSEIFESQEANDIVKSISNSSKYDDTLSDLVCNEQGFLIIPARLKQITEYNYGKEFYHDELKIINQLEEKRKAIETALAVLLPKLEKSELKQEFESIFLNKEYGNYSEYQKQSLCYYNKVISTHRKVFKRYIELIQDLKNDEDCFYFKNYQQHIKEADDFVKLAGYEDYMSNN